MALPNPIQTYFVPVREGDLVINGNADGSFETVNSDADNSAIQSLISISIAADGTVVYYDHWEDGYEIDITNPQQSTTQIWGDGDLSNGVAPGTGGTDIFQGGDSFVLQSTVPVNRTTNDIFFDGSDLVSASFPIAVTRAAFPLDPGSVLAGATEALDTDAQGDLFVIPVGVDTNSSTSAFQMTDVHIMASSANTTIYVNGAEVATIANAGGTFVAKGVEQGDVITTYDPENASSGNGVQVTLVTGDENSVYEMRWYSLLPREDWSNDYYTPVFTGTDDNDGGSNVGEGPTRVWLFNPNGSTLTVTMEGANGVIGNVNVPAGGSAISPIIPNNSGARFFTQDGRDFFAITQTDTSGNGATNDWGHPLIPAEQLTSQAIIGLGFGNTDQIFDENSGDNRSLVWVTATEDDTTVFVDRNGDGIVDQTFQLDKLESRRVVDNSDNNMSGAIIFAEANGAPTDIAVAYGQDPQTSANESNSLDFGTVVPPLPELEASKNVVLTNDADGDGQFSPGDTVTFAITILNFGRVDIPAGGYNVEDFTLPVFDFSAIGDGNGPLTYVLGSTSIDFDPTAPGGETAIADSGSGTPFPLDLAGYTSGAELEAGTSHVITFQALIKDFDALQAGTATFTNEGVLKTGEGVIDSFDVTRPLAFESGIDIEKSTNGVDADTPGAAVQLAEGTDVVWTYTVTNTGETHLANVDVTDDQGVNVVFKSGDTDNDGVLDPGETWVYEGTGTAIAGDYVNEGSVEADAVFADGTTPVPGNVGGGKVTDSDLSHYVGIEAGAITGRVFEDAEADGIENPEGIGSVTVQLLDANDNVVATTSTGANGVYLFDDVIPGDYSVRFAQPGGFDGVSPQDVGADDTVDSDGNVATLTTAVVTVNPGATVANVDQGFWKSGEIGDRVFLDLDGDGIQDGGEPGVEGVEVTLRDDEGNIVDTTVTGPNGEYTFDGVKPGEYTVDFDDPDGRPFSPKDQGGDDALDSDADANGVTAPITVTSGEVIDTVDAGLKAPGSISGRVFEDAEADGIENPEGIGSVTVQLLDASNNVVATTSTDANGGYEFTGINPGDYSVRFVQPGGFDGVSPQDQGADDTVDSDGNVVTLTTATFTLAPSGSVANVDQGFWKSGEIGDRVFEDLDGNGIQDPDEDGVEGVEVRLVDGNGDVVATTSTNAAGEYTFDDVKPGTYTVEIDVPAGNLVSPQDQGGNDALDSDIGPDGKTGPITVTSGEVNDTVDAGLTAPSLTLVKTADKGSVAGANETVTYTYTVTNTGSAPLTGVILTDAGFTADPADDLTPVFKSGDIDNDNVLDVGETWIFEASETITQEQIDAGDDLVNVATVDTNETDPVSDDETVTVDAAPKLSFDKVVTDVGGNGPDAKVTAAGQVISYTLTVKNDGAVTLTGVTITDPLTKVSKVVGDLAPGASASVDAQYTVQQEDIDGNGIDAHGNVDGDGDIDNVATADSEETNPVEDAEEVLIQREPAIAIVKTATPDSVSTGNEAVTFTYTVTNEGNVTLTNITVVDDAWTPGDTSDDFTPVFTGGDTDNDGELDVGEVWTYEETVSVVQARIDEGDHLVNIVTVDSDETDPATDDATVTIDQTPALSFDKIVKDVDNRGPDAKVTAEGQVITYELVVKNDGNVTLTNVTIEDPLTGTSESVGDLAPGATATIVAQYVVKQSDIDSNGGGDGDIDNEATADSDQTDPVKDAEDVLLEANAAIAIVKTADVASVDEDGDVVTYTYVVTNEGNVTLTDVTLVDDAATPGDMADDFEPTFVGGDVNNNGKLDVGETWTFEAEVTIDQDAIDAGADIVNIATVDSKETGPETDDATVTVDQAPSLAFDKVVKDVDGRGADAKVTAAGQIITYVLVAENTGNVTLTNVLIEDPLTGTSELVVELAPGAKVEIEATYEVSQDDFDTNGGGDGDIDNVATADSDQTDPEEDAEDVLLEASPAIAIVKTADVASVDKDGQVVTYTYTVTNEGNVALTDVTVTDDAFTPGDTSDDFAPIFVGGDTDNDGKLDVGETWVFEAQETITQEQIDAGADLVNVATVDSKETDPKTDDETVTIVRTPDLAIVKDVTAVNGQSIDLAIRKEGDVVTWTITVENTGNTTLDDILVEDPTLGLSETIASLAPGDTKSFVVEYVATQEDIDGNGGGDGAIENVATAKDDEAGEKEDDAEVPVVQNPELDIVKTATAVNGQSADLTVRAAGDEITYEIVVTNSGNLTLDDVKVEDDKIGFETVIPELAPGDSRTFEVTYFAKQEDIDSNGQGDGDIDNVAVATDDKAGTVEDNEEVPVERTPELTFDKVVIDVAGQGPNGKVTEAGQVITYALVAENTGNTTLTNVTIEDPLTHASVKLEKLEPGDKATIHTKYTVTQEDIDNNGGGDGDIDNEATADSDETPPEKDAEEVMIDRNPEIAIVKTADTALVTKAGQTITYTYVLTNTGNVTLSKVVITDDNATPGNAGDDFMLDASDLVSGDTDNDGKLDLDETWVFQKQVVVTAEQVAAEEALTNLAIVTTKEGATDSDTATVEVDAPDAKPCTDIEDHFDEPTSSAGATIRINAHTPHENGSNDDDFIWGNNDGNAISANEGDNLVVARGGNDVVNGGNTTDEIYGGEGDDVLNGNGGDDLLSGGDGDDKLYGAHGDDKILAGKGNDLVEGGDGKDRINAGEGNDTVQGEGGDDCIAGGKDFGRIEGTLDDGLKVVLGDELFGNGGADQFEYQAGDGVDFLFDFMAKDGDTLKLFGITEDQAEAVVANTPYGPAAGLVFDLDGDGTFEGGVFLQQVRSVAQVNDLIENGAIEFL